MEEDPRILPRGNRHQVLVGSRWISAVQAVRWRGRRFTVVRVTGDRIAVAFDGARQNQLVQIDYFLDRYRPLSDSDLSRGSVPSGPPPDSSPRQS